MKHFSLLFMISILLYSWSVIVNAQGETVTVEVTGLPEGVQNGAFEVTITFSEAVSGFEASDIAFSDGSVGASVTDLTSDDDIVYKAEITPADGADGDVIFQVSEDVVKPADADEDAEDDNTVSDSRTVKVDLVPPEVTSIEVPDHPQNSPFDVTITFSEPVTDFQQSELHIVFADDSSASSTITNFSPEDATEDYNTEYTVSISPPADTEDMLSVSVPADVAQDAATNNNSVSVTKTVTIDRIRPTVEITDVPDIEKNVAFDVTITFSEPVNGFQASDLGDLVYATARLKSGSDGDETYEVRITPNPGEEGDVTIEVPANVVMDDALNDNTASQAHTVHIDTIVPTVEITDVPDIEKNVAFDVTITFSEPVNGFQASDLGDLVYATARLKSGSDGDETYEVRITPNPGEEGDVTIEVPANVVMDDALNDNTASQAHTVHIDTIVPTVEITDVPDIEKNVAFDVTITFSESVNGFAVDDIALTGPATVALKSGSDGDNEYTATITPNDDVEGGVTVQIGANTVKDAAGNDNSSASNKPEVHIDTIPPQVESITGVPNIEKNVAFDLTIRFSEAVNGFQASDLGDLVYATASLKSGSAGASEYVVTITPNPDAEGDVTIQVPAGVVTDAAENTNTASTGTYSVHIDTIVPTVEITGVPSIEKNIAFDLVITFSEAVSGFQVSDLGDLVYATAGLKSGSAGASEYVVTITPNPDAEGDVTIQVPAGVVMDNALNDNTTSQVHTVHIDTIVPTVEITGVPSIEKNVAFDLTVTFSEAVNGFTTTDLIVTGEATASSISGNDGDDVYTVTITPNPNKEGGVTVQVGANTVQDLALNNNTASTVTAPVHIDTIIPTVTISGLPTTEQKGPFDITVTFSEMVNGFQASELTVTGPATASLKSGSDGTSVYTVTITPNATSEGDVTFRVPAGAAQDFALNNNTASTVTAPVHVDTIRPRVASITDLPVIEKNVPFDITITFSEAVNGFQASDLGDLVYATASLKSGSNGASEYVVTITPNDNAEGDVTILVPAGVVTDAALNENTASNQPEVRIDTIVPTVEITNVPQDIQLEGFSVTIVFAEDMREFVLADITLSGDAVVATSELTGSGSEYTLTITPHEDTDGDVMIQIPANVAEDEATNPNTASLQETVSVAPVWIPDPNLRVAVRQSLGLADGEDFSRQTMLDLALLDADGLQISDLTGLEYATDLSTAELNENEIIDISFLKDLTQLTTLDISGNRISDIASLANLTQLITLTLENNDIGTILPLAGLTGITMLNLKDNNITDLSSLTDFAELTHLDLRNNQIRDVSPILGLKNLEVLRISGNPILDLTQLVGLAAVVELDELVPGLIPDPRLTGVIRKTLGLDDATDITIAALLGLTTLEAPPSSIRTLAGLAHATALTRLKVGSNAISDLTPLAGLTNLTILELNDNFISDLTPLVGLTNLTVLDLSNNSISDLTPLVGLTQLTTLKLNGNAISDLSSLGSLTNLTTLELADNAITDLTPLAVLQSLTTLNLSGNSISDLTPLDGLEVLTLLDLSGNVINDLNVVAGLTGVTTLNLSGNAISDLTPLADLTRLIVLKLSDNSISNLSPLADLTNLTTLELNANNITDITELSRLTKLSSLALSSNSINNLTPLTNLTRLRILNLSGNSISSLNSLTALTQLTTLDLMSNDITDVAPLTGLVNLLTLRLAENPILNTTPLYPLTLRVLPIDIDIAVSRFLPWDVNADGSVNAVDSALVTAALGQSGDNIVNPLTDVNGDGTVNNADLSLISANLNDAAAGAPASTDILTLLSPDETRLLANYPNPFNPETWIPYHLARESDVQIVIYDARGALVRRLTLGYQSAGYYTSRPGAAYWDGRNHAGERVASGVYFYQLKADNMSILRKMVILK